MDYALKSDVPSKGTVGASLGTGIAGLSISLLNSLVLLWQQGRRDSCRQEVESRGLDWAAVLPILMQSMQNNSQSRQSATSDCETKECAQLRSENASLRAEKYSDQSTAKLFEATQAKFEERDKVTTGVLIEAARNDERIKCIEGKVSDLQITQGLQNTELCDLKAREAVASEKLTALAYNTKARFEAQSKEFWAALDLEAERRQGADSLEAERRECADNSIIQDVRCNYVRNKKVIPAEDICPNVVTSNDVLAYYLNGNTDPTPNASGGRCSCQTVAQNSKP